MKRRLMLFLIIIVLATLIFWSNACLVFPPDQFSVNGPRSQPHNLVTATSEGAEEALIIISTENETSIGESIDYVCAKGGRITHIYPPHILIGNLPRAISQQLIGQKEIEGIYYSIVDSSQFKKYGDVAVFAIEAWNNNFMGQASIKGLTPDPEAPEPRPIEADMKTPPPLNESKDQQVANAPYGAGFYDTSEYMIGKISVAIILPESNGAIDWNQENWASWDISNVVSEIQAGLNWWAAREWKANLQFTYTIHVTATSYEPISHPQSDQYLWIGEVMYNIGYRSGSYFDRVRAYLNDRRNWDHTDWAFAIFVAHSWWDFDGMFADGQYFAYAYLGGPFLVMTYDNDGYGIANMDAVTAHETGHVFYALDEYSGSGDQPTDRSGYLNVENQNHKDGGSSNVACIMRGGTSGYTQGAVCYYTRGQIGWRDTDSDGILDIIDFEPDTVLTSYSPDPTQDNTPTYGGTAYATATYPNRNPQWHPGPRHDITINVITRVQYRIGGGAWIDATPTDGTFNQVTEYLTFTASPLATGTYTFQVRALNSAGNWETSYASDVLTIDITPPNTPVISESHCGSSWTTHTSPYFTWSNPGDAGSGVSSYEGSINDGAPFPVSSPYHPTWGDGAYKFKVGAVDRVGLRSGWSNVITIRIDITAPTGSISINAGATYATSTSVTLTLSANDAGSGVAQMRFSNDGSSWTSWQAYATTISWTLASGDGVKTVYVQFKDNAGNAATFTDTIILGIGGSVSPSSYPVFCDSTGNLVFTFDAGGQTWYGVAVELPKDFVGLADGVTTPVSASGITLDPRFFSVYDEELYYPYDRPYYWVQVNGPVSDHPAWPGITGSKTVTLSGIKAPSVAKDYTVTLYYTLTHFDCTYNTPTDFSTGNRGTTLTSVTVKVHMQEEGSTISGTVSDTTLSPAAKLNIGYVTATAADGPLKDKVVAKTSISSTGDYTLTGLYVGTYKITAYGKRTAVGTVAAYIPTDLPSLVTVGRHVTITNVNIAVTKGGEISGSVRLYNGTTPITPNSVFAGYFTLPGAGLPVRLELVDSAGKVVWDTTVNVPAAATSVSYSIKELYDAKGIPAGTYTLKVYACGFIQTAAVSVSMVAPGGVTADVPIVKGGGISGTIYYLTAQGATTTLASGETILVEVFDAAGALKGVWIGQATAAVTSTSFLIRGASEAITPVAGSGFTTVALKTYSGRGVKDCGLADGGYTIRVSVRGFIQPTPFATAVISYSGTGTVSIYLRRGGTISGTVYAKDPTGVYAEYWQRATPPAWEYKPASYPTTRIRAYVYDAANALVGYATVYQDAGMQTTTFSFSGRSRSTADLQTGLKPTALADGTYTVKIFTYGYWQPTPFPTATVYSGGTQSVDCPVRRGGAIAGTITFKEAGVTIPSGISGILTVEAVDPAGVTQGVSFYDIPAATPATQQAYFIYGKYKFGTALDGGLVDGAYTIKLTLSTFTHPTQTVTVAGGSSATLNFDAYRMGSVTGTIRGAVTYQTTPVPLSWVKITLSAAPVVYTAYSADGQYSIRAPDGTYTMTFLASGYKPYSVTVTVSSGATQVISADLVESFEPYHGNYWSAAVNVLLSVYDSRPDLKSAYPGVTADWSTQKSLIRWAASWGISTDSAELQLGHYGYLYVLADVYNNRPDLQSAYPEVIGGDLKGLISWAAKWGITFDSARPNLGWYGHLYILLDIYNNRPDLQTVYPQVNSYGDLTGLIDWAAKCGITSDPAKPILEPYSHLYVLLDVYHSRLDLMNAYPGALGSHMYFERLIDWAAKCGITFDSAKPTLQPYAPQLVLLMVYGTRPDLKAAMPAAFSYPMYQSLINWAAQWGITIDSAKPILEPYASWYQTHKT